MPWQLVVAPSAERALGRLPEAVASAVVEFMVGPLVDDPYLIGGPLKRELAGYRSARRGPYRIVYAIEESDRVVRVVRLDHRSDIYRPR